MSETELSRTLRIDTLGGAPRNLVIEADDAERRALAARFGIVGIDSLSAEMSLTRSRETVTAAGMLRASVTQSCIATGEPVGEQVEERFTILFRPQPEAGSPDEEIELSEGEMDVVFYEGAMLDAGEAVAQTLALAINPWPRSPQAEEALRNADVKSEEEAGPFGALAALRDKLKK